MVLAIQIAIVLGMLIGGLALVVYFVRLETRGRASAGGGVYPSFEANICLRNARLWNAHAQVLDGAARDEAVGAAAQWTGAFEQHMQHAPGVDRVAPRPGTAVKPPPVKRYYLRVALVVAAVVLICLGPLLYVFL